jgi:hypothetical protein
MILALAFLLPLLAVSFWLFVRTRPIARSREAVLRFNIATLGIVAASYIAIPLYFWQTTGQGNDRAWWPMLAVLASIFATIMILGAAGLVRAIRFRNKESQ